MKRWYVRYSYLNWVNDKITTTKIIEQTEELFNLESFMKECDDSFAELLFAMEIASE